MIATTIGVLIILFLLGFWINLSKAKPKFIFERKSMTTEEGYDALGFRELQRYNDIANFHLGTKE